MDEVSEHVVKHADLLMTEAFRVAEKEIGHSPENFSATIARARGENTSSSSSMTEAVCDILVWAGFLPATFH